ncbi:MAG: BrnA antitoxin family protein [Patescibacteria group bacterium]|nr:BrnA antitoxin family protein [Patescibacteria group bacterium]
MKNLKKIPKFTTETEERKFWLTHDSTEYIDWSRAVVNPKFPNLKLSTKSISVRLPESVINSLKVLANKKDVPYQSLMKVFLSEKIKEEFSYF